MTDHKKTPAPEEKGDPCEDCGVPMAIAPALGAYCDNAECPEKKLPQEERVKLRMQRALEFFGLPKAAEPSPNSPDAWPANDPAAMASIKRGLEQSDRGETTFLGTFAPSEAPSGQRIPSEDIHRWLADKPEPPLGGAVPPGWVWGLCHDILDARKLLAELVTLASIAIDNRLIRKAQAAPEAPEMSDARDRIIGEQAKEIVRLAWENTRLAKIEGAAHALTATYWQQEGWAVYRIHEFDPLLVYFGYQTAEEQKKLREWEAAGFPDPNPFQKQSDAAAPTAKPEGT